MRKLTKMAVALLVSVALVFSVSVPALAAGEDAGNAGGGQLQNYHSGDVAAINTMIQNHPGLRARYALNEPWNWGFMEFAGAQQVDGLQASALNLDKEHTGGVGGPVCLSNLPALQTIAFRDAGITEIQLSGLPQVHSFIAWGNKIKNLDLSGMPGLTQVRVDSNLYNKAWSKTCNTFESVSIRGCHKIEDFSISYASRGYLSLITNQFTRQDGNTLIFKHPSGGKIQMYYQWLAGPKGACRFQLYYPGSGFKAWKFSPATVKIEPGYVSDPRYIIINPQKTKSITVSVVSKSDAAANPTAKVTKVRFPQDGIRLTVNRSLSVPAIAYTSGTKTVKPSYASSNPDVATVSASGKIVARAPGTATVTAKVGGKKDTLKVTVVAAGTKAPKVSKVTGNVPRAMRVGTTKYITAKYSTTKAVNVKITYVSSNRAVATVDKAGRLVAKQAGVTTITLKAGGKTKKYQVTVT